jgi:hypothetical protein
VSEKEDGHFLTVSHHVERNPLPAKLLERAEEWRWCRLWHRVQRSNVVSLNAVVLAEKIAESR